jgi:chromosome segregation ATPase
LQSDLDTAEGNISTLQSDLNTAEGNISTLQSDLDTAEGSISTLQSDLDAVELEISNARGGEVDLDARLDGIDTSISNLGTDKTDKYSADLGDGSATSFTLTHSLNTRDVVVMVRENSSPYAAVITDVEITSTTTVTVKFATAPSNNQYRAIIIG